MWAEAQRSEFRQNALQVRFSRGRVTYTEYISKISSGLGQYETGRVWGDGIQLNKAYADPV